MSYLEGTDLLCEPPPHSGVVVGGRAAPWDNHCAYAYGDFAHYDGKYWRAMRHIEPPMFPIFQSGEVPGESDAWSAATEGEALGQDVIIDLEQGDGGVYEIGGAPTPEELDFMMKDLFPWSRQNRTPTLPPNYNQQRAPVTRASAGTAAQLDAAQMRQLAAEKAWKEYRDSLAQPSYYVLGADADAILGELTEIIGTWDLGQSRNQMDSLQNVTGSVAEVLVRRGLGAIDAAFATAKQPWYLPDLPGGTARKGVQGKLKWHAENVKKFGAGDPYPDERDLKESVLMAFVEQNAAEEGAKTSKQIIAKAASDWVDMWVEIGHAIASAASTAGSFVLSVPGKAAGALRKAAADTIAEATGLPIWAWFLISAGIVGVLGLVAWAIINSKAGAAVAGVAATRYIR